MEVLIYVLKSAAILSLFYLAYAVFLKNETFFKPNRYFLFGGILAAIVLPAVTYTRIIYKEMPVFDFEIPEGLPVQEKAVESFWGSFEWSEIFLLVYGIGTVVMLVLFCKKVVTLVTFLKRNMHQTQNGFHLIQVDGLEAPFSFFKYIVVDQQKHSDKEFEMILMHEQAHAGQRHSIDMLVMQLVLVMQWFNPFAWLYKNAIIQNLEYLADFHTASQLQNQKKYQMTLVRVAAPKLVPAFTHSFYQSFIKKRIVMLNKQTSKKRSQLKLLLILPLLAFFMWSFNISEEIRFTESGVSEAAVIQDANASTLAGVTYSKQQTTEENPERVAGTPTEKKSPQHHQTHSQTQKDKKQPFKKIITKNATKTELDALVKELRTAYDVDFNYSGLTYNASGLLTSIKIHVKDNATGNKASSTYSSDTPLVDIVIYRTGDGTFGVVSGSNSIVQRSASRTVTYTEENEDRVKELEDSMQERQAEMETRQDEIKAEMEARKAEMEAEVELRKAEIEAELEVRKAELEAARELRAKEMQMKMEERRAEMKERMAKDRFKTPDSADLRPKEVFLFGQADPKKAQTGGVIIRGIGEELDAQPLYILDGKEITINELKTLDSNDIESLSILKGDSATALYNKKGENGVVLITTKAKKH